MGVGGGGRVEERGGRERRREGDRMIHAGVEGGEDRECGEKPRCRE